MRGAGKAEIGFLLLEDVGEAGRHALPARDREGEAMRLSRSVIGVLPQNHHFDRGQWRERKRGEACAGRRVDDFARRFFGFQESAQRAQRAARQHGIERCAPCFGDCGAVHVPKWIAAPARGGNTVCARHAALASTQVKSPVGRIKPVRIKDTCMKIAMVGSGYVGLVSGACFADFGHDVVCIDKDASKIERLDAGIMPIYEPGLAELVSANVRAGRLSFSTDLAASIHGAQAIFIAVGTPSRRGDGHADLSYVYAVAQEVAENLTSPVVIVTKSTVPVGTGDEVERIIKDTGTSVQFAVVSKPRIPARRRGDHRFQAARPDRCRRRRRVGARRDDRSLSPAVP